MTCFVSRPSGNTLVKFHSKRLTDCPLLRLQSPRTSSAFPPSAICCICQVVKSESLATLGYETTVVASDADELCLLFAQLEVEPRTGRLQRSVTINQTTATASVTACETEGSSIGISAAVDSTMLSRTSLAHFVDLIRDQNIHQLLRVKPKRGKNKYGGHLVALESDDFFLCTCLEVLIKGLPCRHSIWPCLTRRSPLTGRACPPRWRTNASDWTMEPIASKPATLAGTKRGELGHTAVNSARLQLFSLFPLKTCDQRTTPTAAHSAGRPDHCSTESSLSRQ